jgi:hypothetical protein
MLTVYAKGQTVEVIEGAPSAPASASGSGGITVYTGGHQVEVRDIEHAFEQYLIHPNGKECGPQRRLYSRGLTIAWANDNGDWLDRNGAPQGAMPWHAFTVPVADPLGYTDADLTDLVAHWRAHGNKGAYLLAPTSNNNGAWVTWSGTGSANPPRLAITTSDGAFELTGDLAGWAVGGSSGEDSTLQRMMSRLYRNLLHFPGLFAVTGTLVSAKLRLYVQAKDDVYPLTLHVYETDAPRTRIGADGKPPVYGLAAQVGEANLPTHPSVIAAGDMRRENLWNPTLDATATTVPTTRKKPAGLMNHATCTPLQRSLSQFDDGTYRALIVNGQLGNGEFGLYVPQSAADLADQLRPIRADCPKELFCRVDLFLEDDFYSDVYGFKFGLGWDARFGAWNENAGAWDNAAGSGQTDSNGKRFRWWRQSQNLDPLGMGAQEGDVWEREEVIDGGSSYRCVKLTAGAWVGSRKYIYIQKRMPQNSSRWCYEGHSMRMHTGNEAGRLTQNKYPKVIALCSAPSHLGPYDTWDGGVFGTEQTLRMGAGPHSKDCHNLATGRWYRIESQIGMNSIDLSSPDGNGNGVANNDGVLRYWIDGALVGERTNLAWRRHPDIGVEGPWWVSYHGGNVKADHDSHYQLSNFVLAREYIGP